MNTDIFMIENSYLVQRLNEVHEDMKRRGIIKHELRLSEQERFVATLISFYEATKDLVSREIK